MVSPKHAIGKVFPASTAMENAAPNGGFSPERNGKTGSSPKGLFLAGLAALLEGSTQRIEDVRGGLRRIRPAQIGPRDIAAPGVQQRQACETVGSWFVTVG
jgi:hypothetical protein